MSSETDTAQGSTVLVTGATGRMGRTVISTATDDEAVGSVIGLSRTPDDATSEVPIRPAADLHSVIGEFGADALIDFSVADSSVEYVETAASAGVACVVGTTGFDEAQLDRLRDASDDAPVLKASNFAPGVQALLTAVADLAERLPDYDIEVTETYSSKKRDAPSGTVRTLLDRIEAVRGSTERVYGRHGEGARSDDEVGVHARRAGDVTSETEVMFADNHEVLTVTQRAEDRGVFAAGATQAAVTLADNPPGWYDVADVLG
jgi:4-hydroxy-tetrahydrodipicolinate reductase